MTETERLAKVMYDGDLARRRVARMLPAWGHLGPKERQGWLDSASDALAAGYLPPGVPEPVVVEGRMS